MVLGNVGVHDATEPVVEQRLLVQRHADAPDDAAHDLTVGCHGVQDAPGSDSVDDSGDSNDTELLVDLYLGKDRRMDVACVLLQLVEIVGLSVCSMRSTLPACMTSAIDTTRPSAVRATLPSVSETSSTPASPSGELGMVLGQPQQLLAHLDRRPGNGIAHRSRDPRSSFYGRLRQRRVAQLDSDIVQRQAEHVGRDLRHDGVGAGTDIRRCACDFGVAVGAQRDAHAAGICRASQTPVAIPQPTNSDRRASSAVLECAWPSRTPPRLGYSIRGAACWCRGDLVLIAVGIALKPQFNGSILSATASSSIAASSA